MVQGFVLGPGKGKNFWQGKAVADGQVTAFGKNSTRFNTPDRENLLKCLYHSRAFF
jgi:hypothetical protein